MKTTVDLFSFRTAFHNMDRGDQFSYEGLAVLFDYLEELEFCGEEYELDVIALCCDFAEDDAINIAESYSGCDISDLDPSDDDYEDQVAERVREYLEDEGVLVGETSVNCFLYRQF